MTGCSLALREWSGVVVGEGAAVADARPLAAFGGAVEEGGDFFNRLSTGPAMIRSLAVAALLAFASPAFAQSASSAADNRLTLTFETGAETGAVLVALYDTEAAYEGGAPARVAQINVAAGQREAVFDLPAGTYGVKAVHDVNGNGKMDVNPFGMPSEPFAFSNTAVGNMGPAKWDRARFEVSGATAQTIRIR